jgi:ACS family tartrate transporter-like MFS transporter
LITVVHGVPVTIALANPATTARRKIARRLLPFLFLIYMAAFIDRVNVGFAGLEMTRELHFSNEVFGFGAGIFFVGLCLLEIPGAMIAHSRSARIWIAGIMIGWGMLASLTGLIHTATEFNIIRFLLGVAEGGFFPAVLVYLTHWFRQQDRAKAVALFMTAVPVSSAIGGVIAGGLLSVHWLGFSGWRWLLILEGIPATVGGIVTWFYLTDRPKDARWLSEDEKAWISAEIEIERAEKDRGHPEISILRGFASATVAMLFAGYFFINLTSYGLNIWLPKMVQKLPGLTMWQVGLVASLPHVCAIPAMIVTGWNADRTGLHKRHAAIAVWVGSAGLAISQLPGIPGTSVVIAFCIAMMGIMSYYPCYWTLPTKMLSARMAAAACGLITMANLGGFAGPYAIGFFTDLTGTQVAGVMLLVASAVLAGGSVAFLRTR